MAEDAATPGSKPDAEGAGRVSFPHALVSLLTDLPGLVSDRVHLLSLELQRASHALGQIVALGLVAAILAATAWLALWVGIAAGMIRAGLEWPWACLLVTVINLAAAAWAVSRLKSLVPMLALPATLRRLTDSDRIERDAEDRLSRQTPP